MKQIIYILLFLIISSACSVSSSETLFFDQVAYTQKESVLTRKKYPFNPEEKAREPLRTSRKLVFVKDSTTQITYTWKERMKRHAQYGKFYLQKMTSDTTRTNTQRGLTYSSYSLSGSFIASEDAIPYLGSSEKGVSFRADGSCVHTFGTTASDSPISSLYQRLGEYKVLNDTIYIVYYLGKQRTNSINQLSSATPPAPIDSIPWNLISPYQVNYILSDQSDSIRKIAKDRFYSTLIAEDSILRLPIEHRSN